jgi:hypothetical protein
MATQTNVPDIAVEEEDLSKMTPAEFYASAKHQAVRKSLGMSYNLVDSPPSAAVAHGIFQKFEEFRRSLPPTRERTPEWEARAEARKQRAQDELDRLYASKTASTSEIRSAERERGFADDELDFGPFQNSEF